MKKLLTGVAAALLLAAFALPSFAATLSSSDTKEINSLYDQIANLRKQIVQKYVDSGTLTKTQGNQLKENIDNAAKFQEQNSANPGSAAGYGCGVGGAGGYGMMGGYGSGYGMMGGYNNSGPKGRVNFIFPSFHPGITISLILIARKKYSMIRIFLRGVDTMLIKPSASIRQTMSGFWHRKVLLLQAKLRMN